MLTGRSCVKDSRGHLRNYIERVTDHSGSQVAGVELREQLLASQLGTGTAQVRRMGSVSEMLTIVPLHQRPELMEACAELINEEWKKSKTSRIYSLQKSTDSFPLCLVLIKTQRTAEGATDGKMVETQLLGHARLSRVVGQPKSLFMETVVVSKALRGKGSKEDLWTDAPGDAIS
ncbi:N-acetyltransferase 6 [Alligator mississippiensis]|uniref:N-acetyltransferase 6 n=1 Tax=Alligator mississippiensis TaxID=8496 RepID=A0A151MEJ5_ALLMI|nr:N-acetyltransferase 6 [Alligator mississippiensis]